MSAEGKAPLITVIILTKNGGNEFESCLSHVFAQKVDWPFEVIIIDSGSRDNTLEIAQRYPTRLIQIKPEQFNHGETRNLGAKHARGQYIVFLTQDAIPCDENWLSALVANFADKQVAGVFSRQIPKRDCNILTRRALESWVTGGKQRVIKFIRDKEEYAKLSPMEKYLLATFDNVSSCIRRSVWEHFPFAHVSFGEDIEWSKRVLEAGYKIVYEPESKVYHSHNRSVLYEFKRAYVDHQNLNRLFGLKLVPNLGDALRCVIRGIGSYWLYVIQSTISPGEKTRLIFRVPFLTLAQVFGQYLGVKFRETVRKYPWLIKLDEAIKRGV